MRLERYLLLSQLSLIGLLFVCCVLLPSVVIDNGGVSNFGNHRLTVVPYSLSFGLSIAFLGCAAWRLSTLPHRPWSHSGLLLGLGLLESAVLLSTFPRHIAWTYSVIHDDLGIALFTYEFCWSVWLVAHRYSPLAALMLGVEAVGSLIALVSILKLVHLLFIGQGVATGGFSILLVGFFPALIRATANQNRQAQKLVGRSLG
jgi:hypothetical protein